MNLEESEKIELYKLAIGKGNKDYYINKFKSFDDNESKINLSWNWSACIFTGLWTLYRKMYGWFFVFWIIATITTIIEKSNSEGIKGIFYLISIVTWLTFSIFANHLYYKKIRVKISKLKNISDLRADKKSPIEWVFIAFAVIVFIFGVMVVVALPSYNNYVKKTKIDKKEDPNNDAVKLFEAMDLYSKKPSIVIDSDGRVIIDNPRGGFLGTLKYDFATREFVNFPEVEFFKEQGIDGRQSVRDIKIWGDSQLSARISNKIAIKKAKDYVSMWQRQIILKFNYSPEYALFMGYNILISIHDENKLICRLNTSKTGGINYYHLEHEKLTFYPECFLENWVGS